MNLVADDVAATAAGKVCGGRCLSLSLTLCVCTWGWDLSWVRGNEGALSISPPSPARLDVVGISLRVRGGYGVGHRRGSVLGWGTGFGLGNRYGLDCRLSSGHTKISPFHWRTWPFRGKITAVQNPVMLDLTTAG